MFLAENTTHDPVRDNLVMEWVDRQFTFAPEREQTQAYLLPFGITCTCSGADIDNPDGRRDVNPNGNMIMTKDEPRTTRAQRLSRAVDEARAKAGPEQDARAAPVQRAVQYPTKVSALRRTALEAQAADRGALVFPLTIPSSKTGAQTSPSGQRAVQRPAATPAPDLVIPQPQENLTETRMVASVIDLGDLVRRARKQRGLAQGELAAIAGTGRRFISELEAGKPTVEFERMLKVCRVLGIVLFARNVDNGG